MTEQERIKRLAGWLKDDRIYYRSTGPWIHEGALSIDRPWSPKDNIQDSHMLLDHLGPEWDWEVDRQDGVYCCTIWKVSPLDPVFSGEADTTPLAISAAIENLIEEGMGRCRTSGKIS